MDFLDKIHFIGWGIAVAIVAVLVVAIIRNRKQK